LGKQMLYFSDPVLRMRSEVPPPKGSSQVASNSGTMQPKTVAPSASKKPSAETPASGGQDREYAPRPVPDAPSLVEAHTGAIEVAADEMPVHQPLSSLSQVTPRNVEQLDLWMDR